MNFAFSINKKIRVATLLFAVMACTILIRILEDKSVRSMNEAFVSMYSDRLIPAADLFYLAENANAKKSLFEAALYNKVNALDKAGFKKELARYNMIIDSLIRKYEKTYLVKQEKSLLQELRQQIYANRQVENNMLTLVNRADFAGARHIYEHVGRPSADLTFNRLSALMGIQKAVGLELMHDSEFIVSGTKVYSVLQIALAIVIGILIVGIIFTSNVVKISNEKYRLN
ncbi:MULTISPECIES: MCP four helix bundle domain-containing protein [Pedobacter]|uniref:MCP four helix bundle domain-containing protein n=1 Tax=Pedobacter TaxID=84567 RepID=UPI0021088101|nr:MULTISPECIES: MCP four helix bundle domain-containing protein [unclassified Pedobacter]